jgi:type VI protein secretion system component Hcp
MSLSGGQDERYLVYSLRSTIISRLGFEVGEVLDEKIFYISLTYC